jgi:hypothetical protein
MLAIPSIIYYLINFMAWLGNFNKHWFKDIRIIIEIKHSILIKNNFNIDEFSIDTKSRNLIYASNLEKEKTQFKEWT